ncbi:MAG: hypothetical protein M3P48_09585 [Actinomycetota bacterium]|nr:hypothetical protein [Actinomycetota bacterium]
MREVRRPLLGLLAFVFGAVAAFWIQLLRPQVRRTAYVAPVPPGRLDVGESPVRLTGSR